MVGLRVCLLDERAICVYVCIHEEDGSWPEWRLGGGHAVTCTGT